MNDLQMAMRENECHLLLNEFGQVYMIALDSYGKTENVQSEQVYASVVLHAFVKGLLHPVPIDTLIRLYDRCYDQSWFLNFVNAMKHLEIAKALVTTDMKRMLDELDQPCPVCKKIGWECETRGTHPMICNTCGISIMGYGIVAGEECHESECEGRLIPLEGGES